MTGMVCSCSSPDCMVNGCALIRQQQQTYQIARHQGIGWTCPNCNIGVAPHLDTCPVCSPVFTKVIIQTPTLKD